MDKDEIKALLTREVSQELDVPADSIDDQASFMRLGISSIQALRIVNHLRKELAVAINPVAIFEFKTIDELSDHLADEVLA